MSIIDKLATSLNRRDEFPNQELAQSITVREDREAVKELVANLHNKNKGIQSDCIKVLYEIGNLNPILIADYYEEFLALLDHRNNRLVWGAMTALDAITLQNPQIIQAALPQLIEVANKGSVISRDHLVSILIKLCSIPSYADQAFALLLEQLRCCPTNQLPMYAENAMAIINEQNKVTFVDALAPRLADIEKDTKRKRVEKLIRKLT